MHNLKLGFFLFPFLSRHIQSNPVILCDLSQLSLNATPNVANSSGSNDAITLVPQPTAVTSEEQPPPSVSSGAPPPSNQQNPSRQVQSASQPSLLGSTASGQPPLLGSTASSQPPQAGSNALGQPPPLGSTASGWPSTAATSRSSANSTIDTQSQSQNASSASTPSLTSESKSPPSGVPSTASGKPLAPSTNFTQTNSSASQKEGPALADGQKAGIIVGAAVLGLLLIGGILAYIINHKKKPSVEAETIQKGSAAPANPITTPRAGEFGRRGTVMMGRGLETQHGLPRSGGWLDLRSNNSSRRQSTLSISMESTSSTSISLHSDTSQTPLPITR